MGQILASRPVVDKLKLDLKNRATQLFKTTGTKPCLKVILVGQNSASLVYTQHKQKFSDSVGIDCEIVKIDESVTETEFLQKVTEITHSPAVHGVIIQLPLPKKLQHIDVSSLVPPEKDVDGFHPQNIDAVVRGTSSEKALHCCTPKGIMTLLKEYDIELRSQHALMIGRSMIVGKPLALMLLNADATVTMAHSKTKNLPQLAQQADIIISAVGRPKFLNSSFLRDDKSQVLIDVGMNRDEQNKLCGDWDYADVLERARAITPVPGGVGPMTVLSLGQNLLQAAENALYQRDNIHK